MKTAIQELMDIVEMDYMNGVEISMKVFNNMLKEALVKEKAQIVEAFNQGYRNGEIDFPSNTSDKDVACFDNAENYYTETFTK